MKASFVILMIALGSVMSSCQKYDNGTVPNDYTNQDMALTNPLITPEMQTLRYMREEEKLAHDVYSALYAKWGLQVFSNIAASEQQHTDMMLTLLQTYNQADPVGTNPAGIFSNPTLQTLYTQLVEQGNLSLLDALKVGATIEDLDISDLKNALTVTDKQDITLAYQNLMRGSRNHMRAFYGQIIGLNGSYTAQYISQVELDAIVNSGKERGRNW